MNSLKQELFQNPFDSYVYAYPHKTAYRALRSPRPLADLWRQEKKDALFLYFHIPFCEQRCGYCNLFTTAHSEQRDREAYLQQMRRQAEATTKALGNEFGFARLAVGGGTPSLLNLSDLAVLFRIATQTLGVQLDQTPISFEVSPETISPEKCAFLKAASVNRISIGVQSFIPEELDHISRHANLDQVRQALRWISEADFETFNIDLIYGLPEQTRTSWLHALQQALAYEPEELYLYPLYVRPLTGLAKAAQKAKKNRLDLYQAGRDYLLSEGYQQFSMRMFRKPIQAEQEAPVYVCQEDGMVGLGCGARSYTRGVHYSSEYAVGLKGVQQILNEYTHLPAAHFAAAHHGFILNHEEQARRYTLKSLLRKTGLSLLDYEAYLGSHPLADLPQLEQLLEADLAELTEKKLRLTDEGLMLSDAIGPWLYSEQVQRLIEAYELR